MTWISHPEKYKPDKGFVCFTPSDILVMEQSGNLVFYQRSISSYKTRTASWESNTSGEGNFLVLKDDGILVIYDKNNQQIWSSVTEDIRFCQ